MNFTHGFIFFSALSFMTLSVSAAIDKTAISIQGYIYDNTCAVSADSVNIPVNLQTNNAKDFFRVGYTAPEQSFSIVLSPCGKQVTGIKVMFTGAADDRNTELLKLDSGTGMAAGLGIQLLDKLQQPLVINTDFPSLPTVALGPGTTNTLTYYARLVSTQFPVRAGTVSSTATFTLEYQ